MGIKSRLKELKKPQFKLDFGCGPHKAEGFMGVDKINFGGVDFILDIGKDDWPWDNASVIEARASHFVEHLKPQERTHFVNELYRVLVPEGKCLIIVPHWASCRAYGDPTHEWPPVSEFWFYYMSKDWRKGNAPHTDIEFNKSGYNCDFEVNWGYSFREDLNVKNQEYQQFAIANYKEVCQDTIATFKKR
jgi:predicted SAM-dependent methyltransferase